jgi:hypothetical protein
LLKPDDSSTAILLTSQDTKHQQQNYWPGFVQHEDSETVTGTCSRSGKTWQMRDKYAY